MIDVSLYDESILLDMNQQKIFFLFIEFFLEKAGYRGLANFYYDENKNI